MGKISGQEYVQYLTEQFVEYMEKPTGDRKEQKIAAKAHKEPWLLKWFGAGGAFVMLWKSKKNDK